MQHNDPRVATGSVQFPPPGMQGVPVQPHEAPDQYGEQLKQAALASAERPPVVQVPGFQGDTVETEFDDYFGFDQTHRYMMPDGRQWIDFKVLNEGDLRRYNTILKRDIRIEKATGDAHLRIDQVEERHALLQVAVTDWYLVSRDGRGNIGPVKFSPQTFDKWLAKANPAIVSDLADAVRDKNPFLLGTGNETLEAIDKEIDQLMERRRQIVERQQGEVDSATR